MIYILLFTSNSRVFHSFASLKSDLQPSCSEKTSDFAVLPKEPSNQYTFRKARGIEDLF